MVSFGPGVARLPVRPLFSAQASWEKLDRELARTRTPAFQAQLEAEVAQARVFIQACIQGGEKGFVVLDVDDTTLDNRAYYESPDLYRNPRKTFYESWDQWISQACAPGLAPTLRLIDWLNDNHIPYCFVTGRLKDQEGFTRQNLQAVGAIGPSCKGVYGKPNEYWIGDTASNKREMVARLEEVLGMRALASIGDRSADAMLSDPRRNIRLSSSSFYPER